MLSFVLSKSLKGDICMSIYMAGSNDTVGLFLKVKPAKAIILLRDRRRKWYVSALAKEVDTTYPHMVKLVKRFEELGIVKTAKEGRTRYIELTERGDELAHDLEGLYRHLERLQ
ncbi:MAG: hypothetical protein PWP76_201 [Candidatus Diapherotrites archaeon]|nr:hypothetical protein [Candidatus Diapherotrites archaeon]MDN5366862.1 hypothetical protein [Candidatus Diapherotrites archaeon]